MTHNEQEYEELKARYNDAVDANKALRARIEALEKVVEAAGVFLKYAMDQKNALSFPPCVEDVCDFEGCVDARILRVALNALKEGK